MSTHKSFDKICCVVLAFIIAVTVLFVNGEKLGIKTMSKAMGYEEKLFNNSVVHSLDIVIDDWDSFLETCANEEYTSCSVVIDNEAFKNVGLRAKGNTSLSNVKNYGNNRYSLKIEFDKYDSSKTYYGLDKLCLNNIIQDNTYMKDYLVYTMMNEFGVASPLCSYVFVTVNGEDWGLFLAVESVEDSFLQRNYSNESGDLYKPDSMQMGGGRGNGKSFDMDEFKDKLENSEKEKTTEPEKNSTTNVSENKTEIKEMAFEPSGNDKQQGNRMQPPEGNFGGMTPPDMPNGEMPQMPDNWNGSLPPQMPNGEMPSMPAGEAPQGSEDEQSDTPPEKPDGESQNGETSQMPQGDFSNKGGFGNGSDDVKLVYTDDEFSSYSNIFNNAKTKVSSNDKKRLISALKNINENTDIENSVDVESVIRYFVVHNFVLNFDSYTGSMIHNYYLYENDGQLSMIPWDYNLAFGGFMSMGGAESLVNYPIDSPVSGGDTDSRPMLAWIFNNDEYTQQYHKLFAEFISEYFDSGEFEAEISRVKEMISHYVEKDPTKFCTYEEFEKGIETLEKFCLLRAESVSKQLDGTIGSTSETQTDKTDFIKADGITISDMGSMGNMGGRDSNAKNIKTDGTTSSEKSNGESGFTPPEISNDEMPDIEQNAKPSKIPDSSLKDKGSSPSDKYDEMNQQGFQANMTEAVIVSAISLIVLIFGILFAFFYRRKKLKRQHITKAK
ncbi:MAG: CotH kinase family protein [Clostridia bacterium]|nr:CotH kinase family protein [Clostridia bacterium]